MKMGKRRERAQRRGEEEGIRPFGNDDAVLKDFPTSRRRRSFKDNGFAGEASWMSSNINLVNTSMSSCLYLQISN